MKKLMNLHRLAAAVMATLLVASAAANETAATFDDSSLYVGAGGWGVFGWQFSTLSDIEVSALGLYDYFHGDGLLAQHSVGIWDVSQPSQLLVSALIPAGTAAPLVNDFRYVGVEPAVLPAGHEYAIGVLLVDDDDTVGQLNAPVWQLTMGPGLQFDGRRWGGLSSSSLTFPQYYEAGQQESFGPNFTYTVIPEPSVFALCVLGAGAWGARRISRAGGVGRIRLPAA